MQHSNEIQVPIGMYLEKVRSFKEASTYTNTYRRTISLFFFLLWWAVSCKLVSIQDSFFYSGLKKECMIAPKLSNGDTLQRLVSPCHLQYQYARYILRSSLQQSVGNLGAKAHFVQDLSVVCLQADITHAASQLFHKTHKPSTRIQMRVVCIQPSITHIRMIVLLVQFWNKKSATFE